MKRNRPLNLRRSPELPFGSAPNHSSSSVKADVIEWSVNSSNFRFRGVFHMTFEEGDGVSMETGEAGTRPDRAGVG
jgi:hypothetical protein